MRMAMVVLLVLVAAPMLGAGVAIQGTVVNQGLPLPGTTVQLWSDAESWTTITNADGRYSFRYLPAGAYELNVELLGFVTQTRRIDVEQDTVMPAVELPVSPVEEPITFTCSLAVCSETAPASKWDQPSCADYELNTALIASAEGGDRSARTLLRRRFDTADTYQERHRIGRALLGKLADDRAIWNALSEEARISVRFPRVDGKFPADFEAYCRERDLEPEKLWWMSVNALMTIANDRRARAMLLQVLKTGEVDMVGLAIAGLAEQGDRSALPAVKAALDRLGEKAPDAAFNLALFRSADADALAFQYLDEDSRKPYRELFDDEE